jgi:serine/threonine-protein kinase
VEVLDPIDSDERLAQILLDYLESAENGPRPDAAEVITRHPEFATELQDFLETQNQIESLTAPVRQVAQEIIQASRHGQDLAPEAAPPPAGPARPARRLNPAPGRFADELARVLHGRLVAATAIGAAAFTAMALGELASPRAGSGPLSLMMYAGLAAVYVALVAWLVRRPEMPLSRLRLTEVVGLSAYVAHYAWKDFHNYTRDWQTLGAGQQWLLASHSCLNWTFLILLYGVLIPNDWRRSLRVLAVMVCIPLSVYAAAWASAAGPGGPAAPLFDLFAMARLMAAAVAIAVFGAHRTTTLRREAFDARRLGNYRIKRQLSAGGMGEVYLAEHRSLNRPYAIKLIRPQLAADPASRTRFEREIKAMARLTHWNTVEIIDYGHAPDDTFYFVMEFVEGPNLGELVARHGPVSPGRAVYLLRQVCAALAEAHAAGLVHRDIKPTNIMLTRQAGLADAVKVLDFGLVQSLGAADGDDKLTRPGMVVGTPGYMSPEQATGAADVRSDIYSLGAVGYFLLTGQTPSGQPRGHKAPTSPALEPTPLPALRPELPTDLEAIIRRCMGREPEERFADIRLVDRALAACSCAGSWGSEEAAAWWRANPVRLTAVSKDAAGRRTLQGLMN